MLINGKEYATGRYSNLSGSDLSGSDLRGCDLSGSDLRGCNLSGSNLRGCNLSGSNLSGSNLRGRDLSGSDLSGSNLSGSDLRGRDLSGSNLSGAVGIPQYIADLLSIIPAGDVVGYKSTLDGVVTLLIPADAKRSNATGRKCRAEYAVVTSLPDGRKFARSRHDHMFLYIAGETVRPREPFDEDRWKECASGIHFFLTRQEAEEY